MFWRASITCYPEISSPSAWTSQGANLTTFSAAPEPLRTYTGSGAGLDSIVSLERALTTLESTCQPGDPCVTPRARGAWWWHSSAADHFWSSERLLSRMFQYTRPIVTIIAVLKRWIQSMASSLYTILKARLVSVRFVDITFTCAVGTLVDAIVCRKSEYGSLPYLPRKYAHIFP